MYFATNRKDINIWTDNFKEISKLHNEELDFFNVHYNSFPTIDIDYLKWINKKNVIKSEDAKVGDLILFDDCKYKIAFIISAKDKIEYFGIVDTETGYKTSFSTEWVELLGDNVIKLL